MVPLGECAILDTAWMVAHAAGEAESSTGVLAGEGMSEKTTPLEVGVKVRTLEPGDFSFCLVQSAREGWDTTVRTLATHLAHDPDGCFIAEVEGQPAGMVTTTRYQLTGWIGNLIVPPERRGLGIGTLLMQRAIAHLERRGTATIRLEADPMGINIYHKLGFVDEFESPRFRRERSASPALAAAAELAQADLSRLGAFDAPYFGDRRGRLLGLLSDGARLALRVPARGRLAGYLIAQPSACGTRLGPWVAESSHAAAELLDTAVARLDDGALIVAVPGPNDAGCEMLRSRGFFTTPSSLRMVRGPRTAGGQPECVYALATGAVG